MSAFLALAWRDLRLALRQGSDVVLVIVFFVLAAVLYPFALGPEPQLLGRIAAGVVWVTALLAALLSLERLFLADHQDGALDLLALAPQPLWATVLAKVAAHWLTTGVPLLAAAPVVAVMLGAPASSIPPLVAALALGTPSLSLIGAIGAALALGARRGGVLIPLLVLPLYIPVLIFGAAAVEAAVSGADAYPPLAILGALLLAALPLAPLAAAAGLRNALR
ncbi:MAG TPA: heme exporter protein CcmB [Methylomirabilota bacterium]|jgi:heme exporter protein B|nr:heme exporter protein CcmB [Methylomirabilota bacterium]